MPIDATSIKTPKACATPSLVIDFLRISRKSDDNLRNRLGQVSCGKALNELYQEWQNRDSVLSYCKKLSGQFEDAKTNASVGEYESRPLSWLVEHSRDEIEFPQTPTDPRVDAYTSRGEIDPLISQDSFNWIASEQMTESIVRDSTWKTIKDRCGLDVPEYKPS